MYLHAHTSCVTYTTESVLWGLIYLKVMLLALHILTTINKTKVIIGHTVCCQLATTVANTI